MTWLPRYCLLLATGLSAPLLAGFAAPLAAAENDIAASPVSDVSVTVYRSPGGHEGALDLDQLDGFALVSETRTVSIPAGESRVRFEGVADGIDAASAIITGLPDGVLEKNRDARLLSPSALVTAALGRTVMLVRTNPATGKATAITGTVRSDAAGVTFESAEGLEALRCSGLPETFVFDPTDEGTATAAPTPTLSALIRSSAPVTAKVKLSYLARGFDWMANYVATVAPDGRTLDLGAWVTLGNSNTVTFAAAQAQVVAGRLNRESNEVEPVDHGQEILAQCWPRGSTSDTPQRPNIERADPLWLIAGRVATMMMKAAAPEAFDLEEIAVTGSKVVKEEQLGDLKLYRVPDRTSVASRQIKQVRLLDRAAVPFDIVYHKELESYADIDSEPAEKLLRTRNDAAHHLGLPLPSGRLSTFFVHDQVPLLVNESPVKDTPLNQEFEIDAGESADVRVTAAADNVDVHVKKAHVPALIRRFLHLREARINDLRRIDVTNARDAAITLEIGIRLSSGETLLRSDIAPISRNGIPTLRLKVPANQTLTLRYQTQDTSVSAVPD